MSFYNNMRSAFTRSTKEKKMDVTQEAIVRAIEVIAAFVKEHGGQLTVADVARFTFAMREMTYFECVINVSGLYSIDVGTTKQLVRVRTYPGVHSNEMTDALTARILADKK